MCTGLMSGLVPGRRDVVAEPAESAGPVPEVRDARRLDRVHLLELDLAVPEVVEQSLAALQEDRGDREVDLVDQAGGEILVGDGRPAGEHDVAVPGRRAGPLERRLDPV